MMIKCLMGMICLFSFAAFPAYMPGEEEYLAVVEVMPEPEGGLPNLYKNITYPEIARKVGIQGKVFLIAFINENGGVDNVKILKGVAESLDEAAIEGVKKTKFTPGKSQNKNVKVKLSLTIAFKL